MGEAPFCDLFHAAMLELCFGGQNGGSVAMTTSIRPQHSRGAGLQKESKMGIGASARKTRELERWQERDISNTVSSHTTHTCP